MRVLTRMCSAGLNCLVRTNESYNLGIRATFKRMDVLDNQEVLLLSEISQKGLEIVEAAGVVRVEVMGMPSRVMFDTKVIRRTEEGLVVAIPASLLSIERRQSARYNTLQTHMAYVKLSIWQPTARDIAAPPVFDLYQDLASWCPIVDVSIGGLCIQTHFPSILSHIESDKIDPKAQMIFPMINAVDVPVQFRWQKRTLNRVVDKGMEKNQLQFRFGIQFVDPDPRVVKLLRQFMRQLSMAEAI